MRTKQVCGKWAFSEIISTNWREYVRQAVNQNNHDNKQYRNGFYSENDENEKKKKKTKHWMLSECLVREWMFVESLCKATIHYRIQIRTKYIDFN